MGPSSFCKVSRSPKRVVFAFSAKNRPANTINPKTGVFTAKIALFLGILCDFDCFFEVFVGWGTRFQSEPVLRLEIRFWILEDAYRGIPLAASAVAGKSTG